MQDFAFPFSLHLLREAVGSAWTSVQCQYCPSSCITAIQNIHMLGVLLVSIVERYGQVITAIETEERRASNTSETKSFRIGDMTQANSHLHTGEGFNCPGSITVELSPAEWRSLTKKVVKAEINGTSDDFRPGFMSVIDSLVQRQNKWHESLPPHDFSDAMQSYREQTGTGNPVCLFMVKQAKTMAGLLNFE